MRARCSVALAALAALAACDRPTTIVVCHNGNCAEPVDPERDDTIDAFRESLALEFEDRPVIDGIEIDTFWRGSDDTCLYAHDLDNPAPVAAIEPANELVAYFARPGPISFGDAPFAIVIELKAHVGPDKSERHTPDQRAAHAACVWSMYAAIADGAMLHGRDVRVTFQSFAPELLRAMLDATPAATAVPYGYGAIQGIPAPLDNQTQPLGDFGGLPIDVVELHAQWITDAQYEAIESADQDIALYMFSLTNESFAAIEQYEPVYVSTSEAVLFRRWLER